MLYSVRTIVLLHPDIHFISSAYHHVVQEIQIIGFCTWQVSYWTVTIWSIRVYKNSKLHIWVGLPFENLFPTKPDFWCCVPLHVQFISLVFIFCSLRQIHHLTIYGSVYPGQTHSGSIVCKCLVASTPQSSVKSAISLTLIGSDCFEAVRLLQTQFCTHCQLKKLFCHILYQMML